MRSVADTVRKAHLAEVLRLSAGERVALALALGAFDLRTFARARRIGLRDAARELQRVRQAGRRRSTAAGAVSR